MGERTLGCGVTAFLLCFKNIDVFDQVSCLFCCALCVCVCVLMQAGQARVWFHDVILVEERRLVYLFEVVSCASASRSAWCNCLLPSLLAWCCCPLSLLGAKHLCVCGFGQYINLKEKYGCGGFFWEGGEGDVD